MGTRPDGIKKRSPWTEHGSVVQQPERCVHPNFQEHSDSLRLPGEQGRKLPPTRDLDNL